MLGLKLIHVSKIGYGVVLIGISEVNSKMHHILKMPAQNRYDLSTVLITVTS